MADATVFIVDDDAPFRDALRTLLDAAGFAVRDHADAHQLLADPAIVEGGCVLSDVHMPGMNGVELLGELKKRHASLSVIIMTGQGDVPLAVRAMKAGAIDFLEKPFDDEALVGAVRRALAAGARVRERASDARAAQAAIALLTERERDVLRQLAVGQSNKLVAHALGISPRTVEIHRARLMKKLHAASLADLVRVSLAARIDEPGGARES